ncbi:MAG: hypothetical protein ACPGVI_00155 [Crocinitomicaceae bacterium]
MGKRNLENVALMEIGGSHDECLYSQLFALSKSGRKVYLVCTQEIKDRNPHFEALLEDFIIVEFSKSKFKNNGILRGVLNQLKRKNVSKLILNTAQGGKVRNLCVMGLFSKMEFIGIIHTTRKFKGSFTQKIINWKIKKYLLLSEYLLSTVTPPSGSKVDYFYPIRYQGFTKATPTNDRLEVTIIGGVENRRKDLDGFITMISNLKTDTNFTFLGKSDQNHDDVKSFQAKLKEFQLESNVQTFDAFVSQEAFNEHLKKTDVILPLVHPNTPSADQYFKNQISGAMSVAFGYKIPMLIHEHYKFIEEMNLSSIYYNSSNFGHRLSETESFKKVRSAMEQNEKIDVELQEKRFLSFLFEH